MATETIQTPVGINKAAIARKIYSEIGSTLPRKDVITRFQTEAHLTPAGAATYYQTMKKAATTPPTAAANTTPQT